MSDQDKPGLSPIEELFKLHSKVNSELLRKLETGEATAADLSSAVQFLRLNGVYRGGQLSPDELGAALSGVYQTLPTFEDEDQPSQTSPLN